MVAWGGRAHARGVEQIPEVGADVVGGRAALDRDDFFHDAAAVDWVEWVRGSKKLVWSASENPAAAAAAVVGLITLSNLVA